MSAFVELFKEKTMNDFQDRFSELLSENDLSRLKLANAIGISSTTINGYFNNNYYPSIDIAIKICNYFNCSLDYLLGLSDELTNNDKNNNSFINNFHDLIRESKQSISSTLKALNMSEYNYYRWKKGMFPKTINLIEIAKYFNVSIDYLVGIKKVIN